MSDLPYRPCVGIMLINDEGRIFVGERIDTPGAWQMPQGGIDKGEEADTAALRELEEEIGLSAAAVEIIARTPAPLAYDLPPHLLGKAWGGKYKGQIQHWYLMRLTGNEADINIDAEHPEFSRWRWTDAKALVDEIVPFKRPIYEALVDEFGAFLK
ncbi:RNA pyrophosphohydrolase [Pseudokordiimonas caeni]|uniref:RNA pyrophosphohydrolase n=1 Tax=Pseudokordiimonas caeni TaxID=2997908 RepID=UPI00281275D0|nr:RNA pyrophosphohydrolase [Pseudokordiimonas caeni]